MGLIGSVLYYMQRGNRVVRKVLKENELVLTVFMRKFFEGEKSNLSLEAAHGGSNTKSIQLILKRMGLVASCE